MGSSDCIYSPCGDCEYQDSINDEGICLMYVSRMQLSGR